jgi:hypothetical protein
MNDEKKPSKSEQFDFEDESFKKEEKVIDSNMTVSVPREQKGLVLVTVAIIVGIMTWKFLPKSSKQVQVQEAQVQAIEKEEDNKTDPASVSMSSAEPAAPVSPKELTVVEPEIQKSADSIKQKEMEKPPVAMSSTREQQHREMKKTLDEHVLNGFDDKLAQQSQVQNDLLEQIAELTQRIKSLDQEIKGMSSQNDMINNKLDEITKFDKSISLAIDGVKLNVNSMKEQIKVVDGKLAKQGAELFSQEDLKSIKKQAIATGAELAVHAAIPGRVWLRDQNNRIFSVVEGDELPGYGKVLSIDARLVTVMTSSGMLIRQ